MLYFPTPNDPSSHNRILKRRITATQQKCVVLNHIFSISHPTYYKKVEVSKELDLHIFSMPVWSGSGLSNHFYNIRIISKDILNKKTFFLSGPSSEHWHCSIWIFQWQKIFRIFFSSDHFVQLPWEVPMCFGINCGEVQSEGNGWTRSQVEK